MTTFFTFGVLGTSLSHGATRDHSYVREVVSTLQAGKQDTVRCVNMSVDGGSSQSAGLPLYESVARLRLNAILIEYSMNDCAIGDVTDAQNRHDQIIDGIRAISPMTQIFLMTMNTLLGSSAPVLARSTLASHYQMYRDRAPIKSVGLIDNTPAWAGATLMDLPDGLHPTIAAHRARTVPGVVAALAPLVT